MRDQSAAVRGSLWRWAKRRCETDSGIPSVSSQLVCRVPRLWRVFVVDCLTVLEVHYLSFITGLIVGMLTIQIFFHRFSRVLPAEQMPETPTPPRKFMSYAIQATPGLGWREIVFMTALFVWALAMLLTHLQFT